MGKLKVICGRCWVHFILFALASASIELHPYNESMTNRVCKTAEKSLFEGERFVMTAVLNVSDVDLNTLPLTKVVLYEIGVKYDDKDINYTVPVCEVNIERDSCNGPNANACGYCDHKSNQEYFLVFNITAKSGPYLYPQWTSLSRTLQCRWISVSEIQSSSNQDYPYVFGRPDAFAEVVVDARLENLLEGNNSHEFSYHVLFATCISPVEPFLQYKSISWKYTHDQDSKDKQLPSGSICLTYNDTEWESHVGKEVRFHYVDDCQREGYATQAIFEKPELKKVGTQASLINSNTTELTFSFRISQDICGVGVYLSPNNFSLSEESGILRMLNSSMEIIKSFDSEPVEEYQEVTVYMSASLDEFFSSELYIRFRLLFDCVSPTNTLRFMANGSDSIVAEQGDNVLLECSANSDPRQAGQSVRLEGPKRGDVSLISDYPFYLSHTLRNLHCDDSGRYVCSYDSNNNDNSINEKSVDIYVVCSLKIKDADANGSIPTFTFDPNNVAVITFNVTGYPFPNEFALHERKDSSLSEVRQDQYNVTCTPLTPPDTLINLTIYNISSQTTREYVLEISNSQGSTIPFEFTVKYHVTYLISLSVWLVFIVVVVCVFILITIIAFTIRCTVGRRSTRQTRDADVGTSESETSSDVQSVEYDNNNYDNIFESDPDEETGSVGEISAPAMMESNGYIIPTNSSTSSEYSGNVTVDYNDQPCRLLRTL